MLHLLTRSALLLALIYVQQSHAIIESEIPPSETHRLSNPRYWLAQTEGLTGDDDNVVNIADSGELQTGNAAIEKKQLHTFFNFAKGTGSFERGNFMMRHSKVYGYYETPVGLLGALLSYGKRYLVELGEVDPVGWLIPSPNLKGILFLKVPNALFPAIGDWIHLRKAPRYVYYTQLDISVPSVPQALYVPSAGDAKDRKPEIIFDGEGHATAR